MEREPKVMLVIKGARYFRGNDIVVPMMSGEYFMVDCENYVTLEELKGDYDPEYVDSVKNNYIEYQGVKYYYAEWGPEYITDEWRLISDVSGLELIE